MSESRAGELIDIENDTLNSGEMINVFNYLNNDWKNAVVQEIDISEREILVNYEDDSQEWISVDTRKIRFPPPEDSKTPSSTRRRTSTIKVIENIESKSNAVPKEKSPAPKDSREKLKKPSKTDAVSKKSSSASKSKASQPKSSEEKKTMSSQSTPSFWRLKFKSNTQLEMTQRKRDKRDHSRKIKPVNESETNSVVTNQDLATVPKITITSKSATKSRSSCDSAKKKRHDSERKEDEKEDGSADTLKRKTPSRKNSISSSELADKIENVPKSAPVILSAGKKIKTLLPKRASELFFEPPSSPTVPTPSVPDVVTPATATSSSTNPTANVSPLTNAPTASGFICPNQDCKKQFRNENLLMMHLKHYHLEYRNMLRSMPNVADLAYARTVGEIIDSPQSGFLEKIVKLEEDKLKERVNDSPLPGDQTSVEKKTDESATTLSETIEKTPDVFAKGSKAPKKSVVNNKRVSDSAPSSPKMPALLAQLQEPPLIPPSISIHSENTDSELSILHSTPVIPSSPQIANKSKASVDKSPVQSDSEDKYSDGQKSPTRKRRLSHLDSTDVINCTCCYGFEDGLMIRCDLCLCWQHGACNSAENEEDVPSTYICEPCLYPRRQHSSKKYCYVQNWVKDGIMPAFEFCEPPEGILKKREKYLKHYHEYLCHLMDLRNAVRSLQVKLQILTQTPEHPKLYLWAKSWDEMKTEECKDQLTAVVGPVPEAAINTADCRKNLSKHIAEGMKKLERTIINLEKEIEKLDENDDDEEDTFGKNAEKDRCTAKQTLLMMMRDLSSIQNLKYC